MTTPAARRLAGLSLVACVATAGFAGCSNSKPIDTTPTKAAPTVSATPLPKQPTFKGTPQGAVFDVKITKCDTKKGKQTAEGTVTNSSKSARDYAIFVMWLKNNDGTPYGSALVKVNDAKPGVATKFTATTTVATDVDKCVLNVTAGQFK